MTRSAPAPRAARGLSSGTRRAALGAALGAAALAAALAACAGPRDTALTPQANGTAPAPNARGAPPAGVAVGGAGEWVTQGKDLALTRFSDLSEITTANVANLKTAWSFSTGVLYGHEGAPLVVGKTMYLVTPYPDIAYALDLTKQGAIKWKYQPNTDPWAVGVACCDVVNRGWAFADGKLIYNLLDNRTIALDTATGQPVWQTKLGDPTSGQTMTMAPLVVKDKVLVGNSGGEMGVRGFLAALDVHTGKLAWRAYATGPDKDVLIGPDFKPFYARDRGTDLGVKSWPADAWRHGAGASWGWISYDPELNLIYYGTSNPSPWNQEQRPGDNKWTATIFARDPDTGAAKWALQTGPHDDHDYDAVNEDVLIDLPMHGPGSTPRKVMTHFDRNGFGYTIDRATGEVLVANMFGPYNWADGFDLATGLPRAVEAKHTHQGVNVTNICPSDIGGKNQNPTAFSPRTGLMYVPVNTGCMDYEGVESSFIAGTPYWGAHVTEHPGADGNWGEFIAWDPVAGRRVWQLKEHTLIWSGALVTAGDVVFYGTTDGYFKAVDARTGKPLWQQKLGSGVSGPPMTYRGPDGKQYVAVLTGVGGAARVSKGSVESFPAGGGTLYVFSL
ncbi:methanol dehydrogenase [Gemmatimonadetes bacterium T265]|nr:methanol dehydrogenase [Gemmatimonadetes bacterium T265]